MVNHVRNLLMNVSGDGYVPSTFGQYVPSAFRPLPLSSDVLAVRTAIFGRAPDTFMLDYRTHQLMTAILASDLKEYATSQDPRLAISRIELTPESSLQFRLGQTQLDSGDSKEVFVQSADVFPDESGKTKFVWSAEVLSGSRLRLNGYSPEVFSETYDYDTYGGLSDSVVLRPTRHKIRVPDVVGARWKLFLTARPRRSLAEVLNNVARLGETTILELFGVGSPRAATEPGKTFYETWKYSPHVINRAAALSLAIADRMVENANAG